MRRNKLKIWDDIVSFLDTEITIKEKDAHKALVKVLVAHCNYQQHVVSLRQIGRG